MDTPGNVTLDEKSLFDAALYLGQGGSGGAGHVTRNQQSAGGRSLSTIGEQQEENFDGGAEASLLLDIRDGDQSLLDFCLDESIPQTPVVRRSDEGQEANSLFGTPAGVSVNSDATASSLEHLSPSNPELISASSSLSQATSWDKVDHWLRERHPSDKGEPLIERNDATLAVLRRMMAQDERRGPVMRSLHAENITRHKEEYSCEATRMDALLAALSLSTTCSLPKRLSMALDALADLAAELHLNDVQTSTYFQALSDLQWEMDDAEGEILNLEAERRRGDVALAQARASVETQRRFLASLESDHLVGQQKTSEWNRNTAMLERKQQEYTARQAELQSHIDAANIESHRYPLMHKLEEAIATVEADCRSDRHLLDAYLNLPPDLALANLKLAEGRQELSELQTKREHLLVRMAHNV